jgi:hypothetical protein
MGTGPVLSTCLLTPRENAFNQFDAKPGMLTLKVKDINGSTNLDTARSTVRDITDSASPIEVSCTCTQSSFSYQVQAGKTYFVALVFAQNTSPNETVAELDEGGKRIDIITITNLFLVYVLYA